MTEQISYNIIRKVKSLPFLPGAYIFKDKDGNILYIGKASQLKKRVASYFQKRSHLNKTGRLSLLVSRIADFDWIVTDSEQEAFLLEYQLIKQYNPFFNVQFRDDKRYPYIKLTLVDPFPFLSVVRKPENDGNKYFGPYVSSGSMRQTLKLLRQVFKIRSCIKKITGKDSLCLYYHIKECSAPCIGAISLLEYKNLITEIIPFLEGKNTRVVKRLEERMREAGEDLNFEEAARIRDQICAVRDVTEPQKISKPDGQDQDIINIAVNGNLASVAVFTTRSGNVIGKEHFIIESIENSEKEILTAFLQNYYSDIRKEFFMTNNVSKNNLRILLPFQPAGSLHLKIWGEKILGKRIDIYVPRRGDNYKLIALVKKNAELYLNQALLKEIQKNKIVSGIEALASELHLPRLPFRIEGYDISNLFGRDAVGSMVAFWHGVPKKDDYRKFKIKTKHSPDDCAMLGEVIARRFKRGFQHGNDSSFKNIPDLILIDGGKGQLNAAIKELRVLGLSEQISILSLAKENEEIYSPDSGEPVLLSRDSLCLKLLQRVRDEAHRFAVSFHRRLRGKRMFE